jgi:hypothetical protein
VFVRDLATNLRYVLKQVHPDCGWVLAGEGVATRKYDGVAFTLDDDGEWWARRAVKDGKAEPPGFVAVDYDAATEKTVGWEPANQSGFGTRLLEAVVAQRGSFTPGTYELCGPKVNGNPERFGEHVLVRHGWAPKNVRAEYSTAPRDFAGLRAWLLARVYEGIVWHHPDGRMAKLKRRDFPAEGR